MGFSAQTSEVDVFYFLEYYPSKPRTHAIGQVYWAVTMYFVLSQLVHKICSRAPPQELKQIQQEILNIGE
jgi:hypothetical protein